MNRVIRMLPGDPLFYLYEQFPAKIYPAESIRLKQAQKQPGNFLEACYLYLEGEEVKCRASLYHNPLLTYEHKKSRCIGNYEAVEDDKYGLALLQQIEADAKASGSEYLIGPMNGSTWENYRFSTDHNHPNFFLEPWHPLYYNRHFLKAGFHVIGKYFSSMAHLEPVPEDFHQRKSAFEAKGITFRAIDPHHFDSELEKLYTLNTLAFQNNFLYTPITLEEFKNKYRPIQQIIQPELIMMAEDRNGNLMGYLFSIEDFYYPAEKRLIIKTAARHPDQQWRGLAHALYNIVSETAKEKQFQSVIHAFLYEEGSSLGITKNFNGERFKHYALYGKAL